MDKEFNFFVDNFSADIQSLVYSDGEGVSFEEKFTEHCVEILEAAGETEGARVCSYVYPGDPGKDWKINGYCLRDSFKDDSSGKQYFETLDIFVSNFENDFSYTFSKEQLTRLINQSKRFINGSLKNHIDYIDPSHELYELLKIINSQSRYFDRVNLFVLLNGSCSQVVKKLEIKGLEEINISVKIWDIERFYRLAKSNSKREPIEIKFAEYFTNGKIGIPCIEVSGKGSLYSCYLAIVPGEILAQLYKDYSSYLLESNVRAFLQQTGKINKGIRDTIKTNPDMFLPYNNGISATAESVETELANNSLQIISIRDFQIVNGGQTTASLFHTKKKYKEVDLSRISVQLKLTVIKDMEERSVQVPYISKYANSQNKVSELDLSSNNPFFIRLQELSRKKYVINPENRNQQILWYFERVNGQYREELSQLSVSQQKVFKEKCPQSLKFVKSDVAKFINLWELEPHHVSTGSQKNFIRYTSKLGQVEKGNLPGEKFYKKLIANVIIFRKVDRLFGRKNVDAIGDTNLKSFTVAYAISYFHFLTSNRLDLWRVYQQQTLDTPIVDAFKNLLVFVYSHLVTSANNTLISEYAKRGTSWENLKKQEYQLPVESLQPFLISLTEVIARDQEDDEEISEAQEALYFITRISSLGIKFWDGLKIHIAKTSEHRDIEYDLWDLLRALKERKHIEGKSLRAGLKIIALIEEKAIDVDGIRSLSNLEDDTLPDVKAIYDRMKLLSKDDWSRIYALSSQRNIFTNLETSNVKSVQRALNLNEKINQQSLTRAHESIMKLRKFGIVY